MAKKKSWVEKLHEAKDLPRVEKITPKMTSRWGKGTVVIPAPIEVDELMRRVPKGKLITINQIRQFLAKKHKATIGCPITCGIFAWVAAWAASEQQAEGVKKITSYWRTLKSDGEINPKYPGGVEAQKKLLSAEGHRVIKKGSRWLVTDFEQALINI